MQFVETDLRRPGLRAGAFDVVYSSGVLHHTPDPRASFARLAALARPGRHRSCSASTTRSRACRCGCGGWWRGSPDSGSIPFDPVLRDRSDEPARREAWLRDQYQHPEEHRHTLAEVQRWFAENGVEYLRTYPSAVLGDEPEELFAPAADNWRLEGWLAQLGWMRTLGREGGLFFTIGRRRDSAAPPTR